MCFEVKNFSLVIVTLKDFDCWFNKYNLQIKKERKNVIEYN